MAANVNRNDNSMETILTFENRNASQWSVEWSTAHVPGMDTATGGGPARAPSRRSGRRRLRLGAFSLGALLTMHCRVAAAALVGGFFIFIMFLILSVALLANPLRHFEVYLGQWSISGPGRAFRIIPVFDGIGIAICINAIVRAIMCCTVAAITAVYVLHAVSDAQLPFNYCRDFNLNQYEPIIKEIKARRNLQNPRVMKTSLIPKNEGSTTTVSTSTVGMYYRAWRNITFQSFSDSKPLTRSKFLRKIKICNETLVSSAGYLPPLNTPPYNFFYVEVVRWRPHLSLTKFNIRLIIGIVTAWLIIWLVMLLERVSYGMLIWNNMYPWIAAVPWVWVAVLGVVTVGDLPAMKKIFSKAFHLDSMEIFAVLVDALEVAMYIHSASTGTEIIHGKGLNHYASGHIDPALNAENVWHSGLLLLLAALNSLNAAVCVLTGYMNIGVQELYVLHESTMWIIPMYSRCVATGTSYSHLLTVLTFSGLTFSYMVVAYVMLKTALHTIFEYKVKLVFIEQFVVAALIISCMGLSIFFATSGGLVLLESVDAMMTGIAMPLVCLMELMGLLLVYRSHDFLSDMNVATEESTCATRIGTQWQIIPLITLIILLTKLSMLTKSTLPPQSLYLALLPLLAVALAMPIRSCFNIVRFVRGARK